MSTAFLTDRVLGGRDEACVFSRISVREWKVDHVSSSEGVVISGLTRTGSERPECFDWIGLRIRILY